LLAATPPPAAQWRQLVFLEHADEVSDDESKSQRPQSLAGTLEPADQLDPLQAPSKSGPPFDGVSTGRYTYVEYATGETELYDHTTDPDELTNIAATADAALRAQLSTLVHGMHGCSGAACRAAEEVAAPQ